MATHLVDHVFGCVPSRFVGHGRVEIGAAAEKQSSEGDKGESLKHRPSVLQPLPCFFASQHVVNHADEIANKYNQTPHKQHIEHGLRQVDAKQSEADGDD